MDRNERIERLNVFLREGRLARREFRGKRGFVPDKVYVDETVKGREGVDVEAIIAALVPEMENGRQIERVPEDLMPMWLAWLTPWMEDHGRRERWQAFTYAYAELLPRWDVLSPTDWDRVELRVLRLPLLQLRLISRMPILVTALRALDASVQNNRLPEGVRRKTLETMQAARSRAAFPDTAIIDRAMGCFAEPDVKLVRRMLNEACKMLPPKPRRRPGVVDKLTTSVLKIIQREVEIKEESFAHKSIAAPSPRKSLPAPAATKALPSS